jgi:hypothetical protein
MTTPLPEKEFPSGVQSSAYQKCRHLESLALNTSNSSLQTTKLPALVAARLLGRLLLLVPSAHGRETLAKDIDNTSHHALIELAQFYINIFIKTCKQVWFTVRKEFILLIVKRASGPTPAPSEHPSRPSFEDEPSKMDHRTSKLAASSRHPVLPFRTSPATGRRG